MATGRKANKPTNVTWARGVYGCMVDALSEHNRVVKNDQSKRPRRFELHPTVYNEVRIECDIGNDGFIRFMGVMVLVSTDFTEARLITYGNTVMPL